MVWSASRFFGQDSKGLRRTHTLERTVEISPLKVVEVDPKVEPTKTER